MTEHSRCQPGRPGPTGSPSRAPRAWPPSTARSRAVALERQVVGVLGRAHLVQQLAGQGPVLKVGAHVEIHIPVGRVGVIALDQPAHRHDHLRDVPGGARLDVWRAAANRVVGPGERALVALGDDPGGDALGLGCAQDLDLDKAQFGTQRSAQLWRAGSAVDPTVSCPVRPCRQVEVPLRRGRSLRSVTVMDHCLVSAWNGSWNGALDDPSAASAVSGMTCAMSAASAHDARGRTSCKRQGDEGVESREQSGQAADRVGRDLRWTVDRFVDRVAG